MVEFFDKMIETKEEWLELMANHLSGSCMNTVDGVIEDEYFIPGIKFWDITEYEFALYLDQHGIINCEQCGWWTYEGEGDGTFCDQCVEEQAEDDEN